MRFLCTALGWPVAAAVILAAEAPAPSASPGADEAIAAARREIDSLRSGAAAVEAGRQGLPRLSLPDVRASGPEAVPVLTLPSMSKAGLRDQKTPNGLLDAMPRPGLGAKQSGALEKNARSPGGIGTADDSRSDTARERSSRDSDEDEQSARDRKMARATNPLDLYMAGWMTPRDYALLRPTLVPARENEFALRDTALGLPGRGFEMPTSAGEPDLTSFLATSAKPVMPPPRENAYVQALNVELPPRVSTPAPPPASPAPAALPRPTLAAPVETPAPKPVTPDFAKPPADDKYFKQLKRF
jgi:hypothetical protein